MQITMQTLPTTLAEFEALPRQSPEQVSALFLCARKLDLTDKDAGVAAITVAMTPVAAIAQRAAVVGIVIIIVIPHLTQPGFLAHRRANVDVRRLVGPRRAQAPLVQAVADGFSHLRRIHPGGA